MSDILYTTGLDQHGTFLMGGVFAFKDQEGFPVDATFDLCLDRKNVAIDWCEFLADAGRQKDWKFDSAVEEMSILLGEHVSHQVMEKFKMYFNLVLHYNPTFDWIQVCEYIVRRKRENGTALKEFVDKLEKLTPNTNVPTTA